MRRPHRIRLQAAWDAAAGDAVWTRAFGRPSGLEPGDRVWLVVERPAPAVAVLNGRPLRAPVGETAAWRIDVTADLLERNELRLEFDRAGVAGAARIRMALPEALGIVSLEIDPAG